MKNKIIVLAIVGVVVISGGSFYAGIKYVGANISQSRNFAGAGQVGQFKTGQNGAEGRGRQTMGGAVAGQIIAKDDKSITVKLQNGGSKIVFFSQATNVVKNVFGSVDDLVMNENVVVSGSANSDGSVNAQFIQLGSGLQGFRQI